VAQLRHLQLEEDADQERQNANDADTVVPHDRREATNRCIVSHHDSVVIGCGGSSTYQELWIDQTSSQNMHILGVQLDGQRAQNWNRSCMSLETIEQHCPGFSLLHVPYVLDHLVLNHKLSQVRLKKVAIGSIHCLYLTEEGYVYGMGHNADGQLLSYDQNHALHRNNVSLPTLILWFVERNIRIRDIACGGWFSAFITTTGELYTVGRLGSNYSSTIEPVLRPTNGFVATFGAGNEHLVYQCDHTRGNQVYSIGSNTFGQLGNGTNTYADDAVSALVQETSGLPPRSFDLGRLVKIDGGEKFTAALTSQGEVYVAGSIDGLTTANTLSNNSFAKLNLDRLGNAHIKDFSCSWYSAAFVDSMKRVFTYPSLASTQQDHWCIDASTLANPIVSAGANGFVVIDANNGRLFNLEINSNVPLKLVEHVANSNCCQMFDHPHYQVTSCASGYFVNVLLLKSASSRKNLDSFMSNLKHAASHSILSDVDFILYH